MLSTRTFSILQLHSHPVAPKKNPEKKNQQVVFSLDALMLISQTIT